MTVFDDVVDEFMKDLPERADIYKFGDRQTFIEFAKKNGFGV